MPFVITRQTKKQIIRKTKSATYPKINTTKAAITGSTALNGAKPIGDPLAWLPFQKNSSLRLARGATEICTIVNTLHSHFAFISTRSTERIAPLSRSALVPKVFVNRDLYGDGANSSNSAALCGATCCTRDTPGVVLRGNFGRRGLRVHPNCDSRGDANRRLAPERSLAVLPRPRLIHWSQALPLGTARPRNDLQGTYR